jgi:hypothetical protein
MLKEPRAGCTKIPGPIRSGSLLKGTANYHTQIAIGNELEEAGRALQFGQIDFNNKKKCLIFKISICSDNRKRNGTFY